MFDRLLVRQKLNLLIAVPICLIILIAVPFVAGQVSAAAKASSTARLMVTVRQVDALIEVLETENVVSDAYLAAPAGRSEPLIAQQVAARDAVYQVRNVSGGSTSPALDQALDSLANLEPTRTAILNRGMNAATATQNFEDAVITLIDALDLSNPAVAGRAGSGSVPALGTLLRINAEGAYGDALLMAAAADAGDRSILLSSAVTQASLATSERNRLNEVASPAQLNLVELADGGATANTVSGYLNEFTAAPATLNVTNADHDQQVIGLLSAIGAQNDVRRLALDKIARDVAVESADASVRARTVAFAFGGTAALVLALLATLTIRISRSISVPLRRLTAAARQVADLAQTELVRVTDDEQGAGAPRLAAVDVSGRDEIGDLAGEINRVQASAALLLERQVVIRRNVAEMFGNIGRRTQNLVRRQHALIDALEKNETDPELLQDYYRLDHLTSRLRRKANSLVVISGATEFPAGSPVPLVDVLRAALGEIEEYRRIHLHDLDGAVISAGSRRDLVLLFAELLENAVSFSPPSSRVEVHGEPGADEWVVRIVDHGVGVPADRLDGLNVRVQGRERIDLTPTDVLGLFVVGRLNRRLGTVVTLMTTVGGGVTATVRIPAALFAGRHVDPAAASWTDDGAPRPARHRGAPGGAEDAGIARRPESGAESREQANADALRALPLRDAVVDILRASPQHAGPRRTRTAAPGSPAASPAASPSAPPPAGRAGLTRRVPGGRLPEGGPTIGRGLPPTGNTSGEPADPAAARSLIEQFEAGATRAQNIDTGRDRVPVPRPPTSQTPATPAAPRIAQPARVSPVSPASIPPAVGPAATGDTGDVVRQIEAEIRRELTAYQSGHRDRFDDDFDWLRPRRRTPAEPTPAPAPAAPPAPAPAAPPGAAGLRRRVPGRNLAETRPAEPQPRPMPESDAAAARSLIQQLEAGVARAQRAAAEDPSKGDRR